MAVCVCFFCSWKRCALVNMENIWRYSRCCQRGWFSTEQFEQNRLNSGVIHTTMKESSEHSNTLALNGSIRSHSHFLSFFPRSIFPKIWMLKIHKHSSTTVLQYLKYYIVLLTHISFLQNSIEICSLQSGSHA